MGKRKIVIIICIIAVIAGITAFAVYEQTDILKSNEQLFFEYVAQNGEIINKLEDDDLEEYIKKQEQSEYSNKGKITVQGDSNNKLLNNTSIEFEGKKNQEENYAYQKIDIKYSANESWDIEYLHQDDLYAIRVNNILKKFIGIENSNLEQWGKNLQLDDLDVPDKIESKIIKIFNIEEKQDTINELKDKYFNIFLENLNNEMFSKNKENEYTTYALALTEQQFREIIIKILENLKDDEIIINEIKTYLADQGTYSEKEINNDINDYKSNISSYINNLKNSIEGEGFITFKVYAKNRKLVKTEIIDDEENIVINKLENGLDIQYIVDEKITEIKIEKEKKDDDLKYIINFDIGDSKGATIEIGYTDLESDEVTETVECTDNCAYLILLSEVDDLLGINTDKLNEINLQVSYTNIKNFSDNMQIEEIDESKITILNGYDLTGLLSLGIKIQEQISNVNENQMNNLNIETKDNPFKYYTSAIIPVVLLQTVNLFY